MSHTMNTALLVLSLFLVACGAPINGPEEGDGGVGAAPDSAAFSPPGSPEDGQCRAALSRDDGVAATRFMGLDSRQRPRCTYVCREGWQTCIEACDSQLQRNRGGCGTCGNFCNRGFTCRLTDVQNPNSPLACLP